MPNAKLSQLRAWSSHKIQRIPKMHHNLSLSSKSCSLYFGLEQTWTDMLWSTFGIIFKSLLMVVSKLSPAFLIHLRVVSVEIYLPWKSSNSKQVMRYCAIDSKNATTFTSPSKKIEDGVSVECWYREFIQFLTEWDVGLLKKTHLQSN